MRKLECLGGPLCGSKVRDNGELWMVIRHVDDETEEHFYKRVQIVEPLRMKSCLVWHYHGRDETGPGVPMLRPARRLFR